MKTYDKLIRDRIPEIIAERGGTSKMRVCDDDAEYLERLVAKLREEVDEFAAEASQPASRQAGAEELADILEVIRALCLRLGFDPQEVEALRAGKEAARGGFAKRLILLETD